MGTETRSFRLTTRQLAFLKELAEATGRDNPSEVLRDLVGAAMMLSVWFKREFMPAFIWVVNRTKDHVGEEAEAKP